MAECWAWGAEGRSEDLLVNQHNQTANPPEVEVMEEDTHTPMGRFAEVTHDSRIRIDALWTASLLTISHFGICCRRCSRFRGQEAQTLLFPGFGAAVLNKGGLQPVMELHFPPSPRRPGKTNTSHRRN